MAVRGLVDIGVVVVGMIVRVVVAVVVVIWEASNLHLYKKVRRL